jgi:hypothetical protein
MVMFAENVGENAILILQTAISSHWGGLQQLQTRHSASVLNELTTSLVKFLWRISYIQNIHAEDGEVLNMDLDEEAFSIVLAVDVLANPESSNSEEMVTERYGQHRSRVNPPRRR